MEKIVLLSDQQARWNDKATERAILRFLADFQPDKIINLGDLFDFEAISSFRTSLKAKQSIMDDWRAGRQTLRRQREVCPKAEMVLVEGNHEARVAKYLIDNAPALEDVPSLAIDKFLAVEDFGVSYIGPHGAGYDWHGVLLYHGALVSMHSSYTAKREYTDAGTSGVSGHSHRMGSFYFTDRSGTHCWLETGCLCYVAGPNVPPSTRGPRVQNWQQGFVVGYYDNRLWNLYQVSVTRHEFIWEGKLYRP